MMQKKDCVKYQKVLESADINRGKPNGQRKAPLGYKGDYDKQRGLFREKNAEAKAKRKGDRINSLNDGSDNKSDDDESDYSDSNGEQNSESGHSRLCTPHDFKTVENGVPMRHAHIDQRRET